MSDAAADPAELLGLAIEMARAAGDLLLEARSGGRHLRRLGATAVRKSSPTDLATDADRASEALVREMLSISRPDDALLGEEGGASAGTSGLTWIVDPLDGTTNYVYDFPAWCVSIAVSDAEGALAGVVHDPLRSETFSAARGLGACLGGERIARGAAPPLGEALVGTGFSYSPSLRGDQARLLPTLLPEVRDIRRAGSAAIDLCSVAAGRLDAFYEAGLKPWDSAAGLLIAHECGIVSAEIDDVIASKSTLVAAPPELLDELVALLRRARPAV
ncbi:MAG: Inositol-monophosphatase [Acidimicrobiaceae bacterium]|nr:Inositol-monophosphatase [Acidimicrobiaceae bacterium]